MYPRNIMAQLLEALRSSPVVLLHGARQTGKTTLVKTIATSEHPAQYLTFDNPAFLSAALSDPVGFLSGLEGNIVLDEIQKAPELFPVIKMMVDERRQAGRFLLTGSANVFLVPRLSESLAGRMQILTLYPFSQGEREDKFDHFVDVVFSDSKLSFSGVEERSDLWQRVLQGGYPEAFEMPSERDRHAWLQAYITTILQRDVRDFANIEGLTEMPRLLTLLAARTATLLNLAELSREIAISQPTLRRYKTLLEATFLIHLLPAWLTNVGKRLVKSPKIVLNDTGLVAALLNLNRERLSHETTLLGRLLENFVVMELLKQISWSETHPQMFHFRTHEGREVDIVLEDPSGKVVGIEVKASATPRAEDFKGLRALADLSGNRLVRGVLLYLGDQVIPFGKFLYAVPLRALWQAEQ